MTGQDQDMFRSGLGQVSVKTSQGQVRAGRVANQLVFFLVAFRLNPLFVSQVVATRATSFVGDR